MRTASRSSTSQDYGVKGIPAAFLIAPDGTVAWSGSPMSLSSGKIKEVLEDAEKPPDTPYLAVRPSSQTDAALEAAVKAAKQGKLGKALEAARKAEASSDFAKSFVADIEGHMDLLLKQANAAVESRDVLPAVEVLTSLSKAAPGTEQAAEAEKRIEAIEDDDTLKNELEAARAFEKTKKSVAKLSTAKKRGKYEQFAKKYAGTKAGETAKVLSK